MSKLVGLGAFGNVHNPGIDSDRHRTINMILGAADGQYGVATFNEAEKDQAYIKATAASLGMSSFGHGELAMAYSNELTCIMQRYVTISPGGYIGADGVKTARRGDDDRRVGPSRGILIAVFYDPINKVSFFRFTSHDLAKAGTTARWRQRLLFGGWSRTAEVVNMVLRDVPFGSGDGDKNWNSRVNYPGTPDVSISTPPTFGNRIYDQINVWGNMAIQGLMGTETPSDHDMLNWTYVIDSEPHDPPVVEVSIKGRPIAIDLGTGLNERFGPGTKAPVRRPRMRRTRGWKRRHPVLWRRLRVWRRNNPRKRGRR